MGGTQSTVRALEEFRLHDLPPAVFGHLGSSSDDSGPCSTWSLVTRPPFVPEAFPEYQAATPRDPGFDYQPACFNNVPPIVSRKLDLMEFGFALPRSVVPLIDEPKIELPPEVLLMRDGGWVPPNLQLPDLRTAVMKPFNDLTAFADKSKMVGIIAVLLLAVNAGARILEWRELKKTNELLGYQSQLIGSLIERLDATMRAAATPPRKDGPVFDREHE